MIKRVPGRRHKGRELIPTALDEAVADARELISTAFHEEHPRRAALLADLDRAEAKFRVEPPPNVVQQIEEPWVS